MTPSKDTQPEIWVLTSEYNDYDQHGAYFNRAWVGKPTVVDLKAYAKSGKENWSKKDLDHILNGGGRRNWEEKWYNLEKQV
jgi:hypothetical protein